MSSQEGLDNPIEAFNQEQADIYRTRWLAAHNSLRDLVNGDNQQPQDIWRTYLHELIEAERTIRKVA